MPRRPIPAHRLQVAGDAHLNPVMAGELGDVRGGMQEAAEAVDLPERFIVEAHTHRPAMLIHDTETGRTSVVSLFAYREVRKALNDLFGPPPLSLEERARELGIPARIECAGATLQLRQNQLTDQPALAIVVDGVESGWLNRHADDKWAVHDVSTPGHDDRYEGETLESLEEAVAYVEDTVVPALLRLRGPGR